MRSVASAAATSSGRWPSTVKAIVGVRPCHRRRSPHGDAGDRQQARRAAARTPQPRRRRACRRPRRAGTRRRPRRRRSPRSSACRSPTAAARGRAPGAPWRPAARRARPGRRTARRRAARTTCTATVARTSQPSAPMSIAAVRGEVHGVDEHLGPGGVGGGDDRGEVGDRAEQVRRAGDGAPTRPLVDEVDHGGRVERCRSPGRTGRARARRRPGRRPAATA